MMRKRLLMIVLAALLCLPLGLIACGGQNNGNGLQTVEITNKSELQAEWYVGDNDRTITLAYTPNGYSVKDLTVVSSSDAVTVNAENSLKLRAAKKGSATITVTADGKTDSVTVTVKDYDAPDDPELETVEITNKTELQSEWNLGDADRTIVLAFTPNDFTPSEISVTSDSAAVTVDATDKLKLHAAEQGEATVTVTADGKTDSVTITVTNNSAPPIEELTGITLNESVLTAPRFIVGESRNIVVTYGTEGFNSANTPATASVTGDAVTVNGLTLTAAKAGTATVTVKVGSGANEKSATVEVTVLPELNDITVTGATVGNDGSNAVDYNGTLTITVAPSNTVNYNFEQANIEVASDNTDDVTVTAGTNEGEYKITAKKVGDLTVSITARNNICKTLKINCVPTAPTLELTTVAYKALTKENVVLDLTAAACDSTDNLDVSVAVKDASGNDVQVVFDAANKKFALSEKGNYSVTVTAKDRRDNTKQQTATATVEVYRNVFKAVSGRKHYSYPNDPIEFSYTEGHKFVEDSAQTVGTSESNIVLGQFDMEPSEYYYAQATFNLGENIYAGLSENNLTDKMNSLYLGMTHSLPVSGGRPTRWLAAMVNRGDRNFRVKDIDMTDTTGKADSPENDNPACFDIFSAKDMLYRNQLVNYGGLSDSNSKTVTVAVARIGEYFYTFVNDQFVMVNTDKDYNQPTIPGIFGVAMSADEADVTIGSISWITDRTEVENKVNTLYATKLYGYHKWDYSNKYTVDTISGNINYTVANDTNFGVYDGADGAGSYALEGITPYVVFDGDFKLEYDIKITNGGYTAIRWSRGAVLNILTAYNHTDGGQKQVLAATGVRIVGDRTSSGDNVIYHGSPAMGEDCPNKNLGDFAANELNKAEFTDNAYATDKIYSTYGVHVNDTVHFTVERRMKSDHAEYTYKIKIGDNTITRVQSVNCERWSDPVMFMWYHQSNYGTASNITWQTIA